VCESSEIRQLMQKSQRKPALFNYIPENCLQEVSEKEWMQLCTQIPKLQSRRGNPPDFDRRNILNAIFYHIREKIPLSRIPFPTFPTYTAVEPQFRRWCENGILDDIIKLRRIMLPQTKEQNPKD
jgi:transposase